MKVTSRKGGDTSFVGLDKEEYTRLELYLREKGIRVKSELSEDNAPIVVGGQSDDKLTALIGEESDEESGIWFF